MAEGMLLGVAVKVGCACTWDEPDAEPWDDAGRDCVGEAWAWVSVRGRRYRHYGYGTIGEDGDIVWVGTGDDTIGDPHPLMVALGFPAADQRARRLHGAALRSAESRWDRLVEQMTDQLLELLPHQIDVPEPEPETNDEDEYA